MPGAFLHDERVRDAVALTALTPTAAGMPAANLRDPQPRLRARFTGGAASVLVDFGAATPVEAVALISSNLSASSTARWRLGTLEALVEAAPLVGLDFLAATPSAMTGWSGTRGGAGTGEATVFNAAGDLAIAAGSEWRIAHDPATLARLGLLVEPARTNGVRNPRAEGAVIGSPGTAPTNWAIGGANGVAAQIAGIGTENGMPYVAVRFTGTVPSGTGSGYVWFEDSSAIAGANGNTFAHSYFAKLEAVAAGGIATHQAWIAELTGTATVVRQGFENQAVPGTGRLAVQRAVQVMTLSGGATVARIRPFAAFNFNAGTHDVTVRLALPQVELGAFPTMPILPAAGTPAAATRAVDGGSLTVAVSGAATLHVEQQTAATAATGFVGHVSLDNGSNVDSIQVRVTGASATSVTLTHRVVRSNAVQFQAAVARSNGVITRGAIAAATNDAVAAENGTQLGASASVVMPPVSRLNITAGERQVFYRAIRVYAARLTNGQALALSGTGSSIDATGIAHDTGAVPASTGDEANGNVVLLRSGVATARYLLVDVADASLAAIDIGILAAGPLWRLARGMAYGVREGRVVLDQRDRNPLTGAEFVVPALANPRFAAFTLPALSRAEATDAHRDLVRRLGAARDALWIPETGDTRTETNRRAIWGAVNQPGEEAAAARGSFPMLNRAFRIVERL
ncbi:hypothetical protein [Falsiroseomonas ponticola]|uniref:hypothetical protein n=1 Tax=Falsiroseomonas ponticola TaxID=2786951 RepID=UPI00193131B2|nr:hypothetical protein [Roseomonas ponticola]